MGGGTSERMSTDAEKKKSRRKRNKVNRETQEQKVRDRKELEGSFSSQLFCYDPVPYGIPGASSRMLPVLCALVPQAARDAGARARANTASVGWDDARHSTKVAQHRTRSG